MCKKFDFLSQKVAKRLKIFKKSATKIPKIWTLGVFNFETPYGIIKLWNYIMRAFCVRKKENIMIAKRLCFLSLIVMLAFVFAMAIVPVATQDVAYADDIIDRVELTVQAPVHGDTVADHIVRISDPEEERFFVKNYNWYDVTADRDLISSSEKFVGGHKYRVYATLVIMPKLYSATRFLVSGLGNPDVNVKVNGNVAVAQKHYGDNAAQAFTVVYEFDYIDEERVDEVRIWNLDVPKSGCKPDYSAIVGSPGSEVNDFMGLENGIAWYAPHINSLVGKDNTFEKGRTYELQLYLKTVDGYKYNGNFDVLIDGVKLDQSEFSFNDHYLTVTKQYVCEDEKISTVAITGVDAPQWVGGNPTTPDYSVNVGEHYALVSEGDEVVGDAKLYNGVKWVNVDTGDELANTDEFAANTTYKAVFYLKADANYGFAMNGSLSTVTATVNGKLAECYPIYIYGGDYAEYLRVEYTFAPTGNTIQNIYLAGVIEPENTKAQIQTADSIATGAGYYLNDFKWRDANRDPFEGNFEFGETYYAWYVIWAEDGYVFDTNDYHLFVNGTEVVSPIEQDKGSTHLGFYVEYECQELSINEIHVSLVEPVTNEHPSADLTSLEQSKYSGLSVGWYTNAEYTLPNKLNSESTFVNGMYGAELQIAPIEGYRFASNVKVVINNKYVIYTESANDYSVVARYVFYSAERYTITFDANEGTGDVPDPIENVKDGDFIVLPECELTAPMEGKYFIGWGTSTAGEPVETVGNNLYEFNYGADLTLYALWKEHNHTYDAEWQYDGQYHYKYCNDPECPDREGSYQFSQHTLTDHACTEPGCNYVETPHTISFENGGGTGTQASIENLYYGDAFELPECTFTAPASKVFWCWELKDEYAYYYEGTELLFTIYDDATFVAVWHDVYTITIDMRGHGNNVVMKAVATYDYFDVLYGFYDELYDEGSDSYLFKENLIDGNYYFVGFADDASVDTAEEWQEYIDGVSYMEIYNSDKTFYAVWLQFGNPGYGTISKLADKEIAKNGTIQSLGQITIANFPENSVVWNLYQSYHLSLSSVGLVNDDDPNDIVPITLYGAPIDVVRITLGGNNYDVWVSNSTPSITPIAGNKEYVYIKSFGDEEDYEGIDVTGKIVVVNRGIITFNEKVQYAAAAGAIGLICVNNSNYTLYMDANGDSIPFAAVSASTGTALMSSGTEHLSASGIAYYTGTMTINTATEYTPASQDFMLLDLEDKNTFAVYFKINDPSLIKENANYTAVIKYRLAIEDNTEEESVEEGDLAFTTRLTITGKQAPVDPEPQPGDVVPADPNYPHTTIGGKEVYVDEIMFGTNVNVGTVFASAKAGHGVVRIDLNMMPLSLLFDENAVNAIGGKDVILNANLITSDFAAAGFANIDGIQLAFELVLDGSTFEAGTVTISANCEIEVPEGKQLTVYYINGANKTAMPTTYQDGVLSFTTNHFSKFAAVLENKTAPVNPEPQPEPQPAEPQAPKGGLGAGAIAGIVIAVVVVVAGGVVLCLFLLRKKGLKTKKVDLPGEEPQEEPAEEPAKAEEPQEEPEKVEEPAEEPVEKPAEEPVEEPAEKPADEE